MESGKWGIQGRDSMSSRRSAIQADWDTEEEAHAAAAKKHEELCTMARSGDHDLKKFDDQVWIITPKGDTYRFIPDTSFKVGLA